MTKLETIHQPRDVDDNSKCILAGFTLIEVLIALAIFVVLAILTTQALRQAINSKKILFRQTAKFSQLELSFSLLFTDVAQITARPVLGEEMRIFPPFIGQPKYVEFTRSDQAIFTKTSKQPPLIRIAYVCKNHQLIRRRFQQLDSQNRSQYFDQVLFENLKSCRFAYLNNTLHVLPIWRAGALRQNQQTEPLPKAIQVTIDQGFWGNMVNLFIIPEGLYANLNAQG